MEDASRVAPVLNKLNLARERRRESWAFSDSPRRRLEKSSCLSSLISNGRCTEHRVNASFNGYRWKTLERSAR